ncbi:acyltransferase family protein [Synechococcus sp. WH 8020]|uniref:acyltransferase family protein n=1 Tax=Synechococcus sp. (strain WH8020) TaxID=32052 RepID=UPI0008FFC6C1|nr:acyltransferase family protein [Synechococcus sp. WH 8020]
MKSRYRPEIDGLRAFAVVAVIINHFNKDILPGGYLGVDIFFVISGYVITSSLFGRPSHGFKDFISGFYERRIKRLVPALSVFVLITSIIICLFNPEPQDSLQTGLASLFGWSNFSLFFQSTDYFAYSTELNVFTHTWSLGVEEQFYILFPFLIWFSGFGRQTQHGSRNLFLLVGSLSIASVIGFLYLYSTNQPAAYFLMPSRFWEMAAGCLIFLGFQKRAAIERFLENVPPFLVLALILGVMYLPMSWSAGSTIAVVALSSILLASLKKQTAAFKVFTHSKVVYIGLISYSLYLWHWGVLSVSRWTIGIHWWSVPIQVSLMFGLAVASYRWVETPFRNAKWFGNRLYTILSGGAILLASSLVILSVKNSIFSYLYLKSEDFERLQSQDKEVHVSLGKCIAHKGLSADDVNLIFESCKSSSFREFPDQATLAFVGDSHALNLFKGSNIFPSNGFRLISYFHAGCPFPYPRYGIKNSRCGDFLENAQRSLMFDLGSGDYIVVFNYHLSHLGGNQFGDVRHNLFDDKNNLTDSFEAKFQIFSTSLKEFAAIAASKGITIFLVGSPHRLIGYDPRISKQQLGINFGSVANIKVQELYAKKLNKKFKSFTGTVDNIVFVDPLEPLSNCSSSLASFSLCYMDSDHLSYSSAAKINNVIYDQIAK